MKKTLQLLFISVTAGFLAVSCGAAGDKPKTSGHSSVWMAEKDGKRIYLAGTIHLLRKKDYPLPDVFEQAYRDSTKVVFELPPGSEGDGEIAQRMQEMGSYRDGDNLANHLSPETLAKVNAWATKNNLPTSTLHQLRPWFLALTIAATEYQTVGADPGRGVDTYFEKRAKADGKSGEGLETVEFQLSIFSKLGDKLQEELLSQTFSEAETLQKDFDELIASWRSGDTARLQKFLFRDGDKYPELMEDFLFKRNKAWISPLMKILDGGETAMVLVGAGHLGGEKGVLELLKKKGCTVKQL